MNHQEREHLARADRHIVECKTNIARQRALIERLAQARHDTDIAESALPALESAIAP
jgi:hypothetical protein